MNRKQKTRLWVIVLLFLLLSLACGLVLFALKQNINLFYTPTQLSQAALRKEQTIRVGGYVKQNSIQYAARGDKVSFVVTDRQQDLTIHYQGLLPNLFREGQTVVVTGQLEGHILKASQVLAKHDEKYVPAALVKALKKESDHAS